MPPALFAMLFMSVMFVLFGFGLYVLVNPSRYMRRNPNPRMENTPWTRIELRAVGLVICLFALMALSGSFSHGSASNLLAGFSDNILVALWLAFACVFVCGILSWFAWQFIAVRIWVRQHFPAEQLETPTWERRMSIIFCTLLLLAVVGALLMAVAGIHPPRLARH